MGLSLVTDVFVGQMTRQLRQNEERVQEGMTSLSSGRRINKAADDSAGLGVAANLENNHRGNGMAIRNAYDGLAVLSTAEGAGHEVMSILKRMRGLAVQAISEGLASTERQYANDQWTFRWVPMRALMIC